MDPQKFYLDVLTDGTTVPAALHHGAWTYATRSHDVRLVKLLVARADAPLDLLAEYAASSDPVIRAAYLARADLTEDERARCLHGEKRAKVLRDLAFETRSPAVLDVCVTRFRERPSRMLAEAICGNYPDFAADPDLLEQVLVAQDSNPGTVQLPSLLATLAVLGPQRANRMLRGISHPALVQALVRFGGLDLDGVIEATRRAIGRADGSGNALKAREIATAAANGLAGDKAGLARLRAAADPNGRLRWPEFGKALVWDVGAPHEENREGDCEDGDREAVTTQQSALRIPAPSQAWSADPDRRREVLATLRGWLSEDSVPAAARPRGQALLAGLLANVALTQGELDEVIELTCRYLTAARLNHYQQLVVERLADTDVHTLWPNRYDLHRLWADHFPDDVFSRHSWRGFGGPAAAPALLRQWSADRAWRHLAAQAALDHSVDPHVVVDNLPWDLLTAACADQEHWQRATQLRAAAAARMTAHLGDRGDAWETFHAIEGTFTGTLPELCAAVATATSLDRPA